jgi:tRNA A37 threonylcarbamoyladenosine dehydratase
MTTDETVSRRFSGVGRLFGEAAAGRFAASHVIVVGVGGVGSWVVEGLARSRIGYLTLVDLDMVAESNTNRQIQALTGEFGKAKVAALAERIAEINPACVVWRIEDFITPENVAALLAPPRMPPCSLVIDAIDQTRPKAAIIAHCRHHALPIVTTGAAGGKMDPCRIERADLAQVAHDPLLARTRTLLRREHGFPPGGKGQRPGAAFGIPAIYSAEPVQKPVVARDARHGKPLQPGLSCAGYGSSVCVTASMGFAAAALALAIIMQGDA